MLQNKTVSVWFVEEIKKIYAAKNILVGTVRLKKKKNNYKAEYIKLSLVQSFLTKALLLVIAHIWPCNC